MKRKAASEKPQSAAGPSNGSKPPSVAGGQINARKKARTASGSSKKVKQPKTVMEVDGEDSDVREVVEELAMDVGEDEQDEVEEPKPRGGSRKPASKDAAANARPTAAATSKAKGKQKAASSAAATKQRSGRNDEPDILEVDGEEDDDMQVDTPAMDIAAAYNAANARSQARNNNRRDPPAGSKSTSHPHRPPKGHPQKSAHDAKLATENARLKEEVERLKGHIEDLKAKFEELLHTRQTEPEALMEELAKNHEEKTNVQNELIKELNIQLAKEDPLFRATSAGKRAGLALLSRDEADQEMREYKAQIQNLRQEVNNAKSTVLQKDEEIAGLKQQEKELRFELKTEIERSQQLAKNPRTAPGSATRAGGILKGDDPKHSKVITLYEDLTSILVAGVKFSPGKDGEEWTFTCIYTWKDDLDPTVKERSLNFSLRQCKEPSAENSGQLVDSVHYFPLSLEMESPQFVESLGFLNKPFSFPKTQLSLFVRTLYDNLNNPQEDED
ncbi:hypothetical protein MD484_g7208, partial [Candolleomyces efflorescens]